MRCWRFSLRQRRTWTSGAVLLASAQHVLPQELVKWPLGRDVPVYSPPAVAAFVRRIRRSVWWSRSFGGRSALSKLFINPGPNVCQWLATLVKEHDVSRYVGGERTR